MPFKSYAQWPKGVSVENPTSDTHDTEEAAIAVCRGLMRDGFGGEGKHFPLNTWVEEVDKNGDIKSHEGFTLVFPEGLDVEPLMNIRSGDKKYGVIDELSAIEPQDCLVHIGGETAVVKITFSEYKDAILELTDLIGCTARARCKTCLFGPNGKDESRKDTCTFKQCQAYRKGASVLEMK